MKEIWKDVVGFEGYYVVSNTGRIKSVAREYLRNGVIIHVRERIISCGDDGRGYVSTGLSRAGTRKTCKVHRLVAEAFIENPLSLREVNHKDENKSNNNVENLEWCDRKYNLNYGTFKQRVGIMTKNKIEACIKKSYGKVLQFDLDGSFIADYESMFVAAKATGIGKSGIKKACSGKQRTSGGYIWELERRRAV